MAKSNTLTEQMIAEFTENYIEKLFYFCLKKTGNSTEAEDLTQDITLNILTALNKGTIPTHFSAWVWRIARNRYSGWAAKKHKKTESIAGIDIGDCEIEDDSESILDKMIRSEQLTLLRRELAFIESEYRNIVAAYYIEDRSVRDIAASCSLSEGAVKQRLYRARNKLKEGMNMAREFGIRSYQPEDIYYSMGLFRRGSKNQPDSIMEHKLYVNIFLEAYGNPSSAEDLSLELGVALPYMENELEYLTRETFLLKKEGKYLTAFPIISSSAQEQIHIAKLTAAPDITKALQNLVERLNNDFAEREYAYFGNYPDYESAKWTFLMLTYQHLECNFNHHHDFTERPDNGKWDIVGYQHCSVTKSPFFVGNYVRRGEKCFFQQFRFEFDGITDHKAPYLTEDDVKVLHDYVTGQVSKKDIKTAEKLAEYGYLRRTGDTYTPTIPVMNVQEINELIKTMDAKKRSELTVLADMAKMQLEKLYHTITEIIRSDLPTAFSEDVYHYNLAISECRGARGYIVAEALRQGYLLPAEKMGQAIGAHIDLL